MTTKLFVGSLSFSTSDQGLQDAFAPFGTVTSATIIKDRDSNNSKGFGFVEYESADEAQAAIRELDGKELDGRSINVSIAKPRPERSQQSFGGGGRNNNRGGGKDFRRSYR